MLKEICKCKPEWYAGASHGKIKYRIYERERERIQRQWLEAGKFGESEEAKLGVAEHRKEGKWPRNVGESK